MSKSNIININEHNNTGLSRDYITTISNISNDITTNNSIIENVEAEPSQVYVNSTYGIKIKYPSGWIVEESDAATVFHNQSKSLNVVTEILTPIQTSILIPTFEVKIMAIQTYSSYPFVCNS